MATRLIAGLLAVGLLPAGVDDPRPELIQAQLDGRPAAALELTERFIEEHPQAADRLGLDLLRAELLQRLGRHDEAGAALAEALAAPEALEPWARLALAEHQFSDGHPEVAAGLVATLIGHVPPDELMRPAADLLARSLEAGGDCRLLRALPWRSLTAEARRRLQLSGAVCALEAGNGSEAHRLLLELLQDERSDLVALEAAKRLARLTEDDVAAERAELIGLTLFDHRDFERARTWLDRALQSAPAPGDESTRRLLYARARSEFWLGDYGVATRRFQEIARGSREDPWQARCLYQAGRSLELAGEWQEAALEFRRAFMADPDGGFAAAALLSSLRIESRRGREALALQALGLLRANPRWADHHHRAAVYLAASDILRRRTDRARGWLDAAIAGEPDDRLELDYWRARLAEIEGEVNEAVERYSAVLGRDPSHPLALSARDRLQDPELAPAARAWGRRLATARSADELLAAWLLLGDSDPAGVAARQRLLERAQRRQRVAELLTARPLEVRSWPFWERDANDGPDLLLGLGLFDRADRAIRRHFPLTEPSLALTGVDLLERSGQPHQALWRAEVLARQLPDELPIELLPAALGRRIHPLPWRQRIADSAREHGVSPALLTAIVREESRFDARAASPVGARGLTQFTLPTGRRLARRAGIPPPTAADLERPEVALALGAAYLAELGDHFAGHPLAVVAAYNAGEAQAALWRAYCVSFDPAEYYSKVGFEETRAYLRRVVKSRERYEALYEW